MTDDRKQAASAGTNGVSHSSSVIGHPSSNVRPAASEYDITLNINGRDYPVRTEARRTLVDVIRDNCGLTGTHIGCEHGVCGACTVILDDEAVRACLMFAVQADGR